MRSLVQLSSPTNGRWRRSSPLALAAARRSAHIPGAKEVTPAEGRRGQSAARPELVQQLAVVVVVVVVVKPQSAA
jgi:hypothetical protein